jgi:hypothetical protein
MCSYAKHLTPYSFDILCNLHAGKTMRMTLEVNPNICLVKVKPLFYGCRSALALHLRTMWIVVGRRERSQNESVR